MRINGGDFAIGRLNHFVTRWCNGHGGQSILVDTFHMPIHLTVRVISHFFAEIQNNCTVRFQYDGYVLCLFS